MGYAKGKWKASEHHNGRHWFIEVGEGNDRITIVDELTEDNAHLIVSAVNACIKLNPDNPVAVAEGIQKIYEACKLALADIDRTGYAKVCHIVKMQQAIAKVEAKVELE